MGDAGGIKRRRGLATDRAKAQAWQRDSARRYADKLRARRYAARLTAGPIIRKAIATRSSTANDWTPATRRLAKKRSGGICELCRREEAQHLHHRKLRRHGDHRIVNALHLCLVCHDRVHDYEGAYRRGFLVKKHMDPEVVPVQPFEHPAVFLTSTGTYREAA